MKKRTISLLLALCMALSLLPGMAWAEEEEHTPAPITPEIQIVEMDFTHPDSAQRTPEALVNYTADTAIVPYMTEAVVLEIHSVTPGVGFKTTLELWESASEIKLSGGGCGLQVSGIQQIALDRLLLYLAGSAKEGELAISIGAGFFALESAPYDEPVFTDSNTIRVQVPAPAPAEKIAPTVLATPDFILPGTEKVQVNLYCPMEGVELDWRPLERALYGDQADASKLASLIRTNASDVGLELTNVEVDWDASASYRENGAAYPYEFYPEGVCPVSNFVLTFEGKAAGNALTIHMAADLFMKYITGNDSTVLTQPSSELFEPVSVSIPIRDPDASNNSGVDHVDSINNEWVKVDYQDGVADIRVDNVVVDRDILQIPGITQEPDVFYVTIHLSAQALDTLLNNGKPIPVQINTDLGAVLLSLESLESLQDQLKPGQEAELTLSLDSDAVRMVKGRVSQAEAVTIEFPGLEVSGLAVGLLTSIKDPAVLLAKGDGTYEDMGAKEQGDLAVFTADCPATFVIVPRDEAEKLTAQSSGDPTEPTQETEDAETPEGTGEPGTAEPETPTPLPFTDVAESAWYYDAVHYVYTHQIMNGDGSPTRFNPNGTTTRGMIVTILYRLEGQPEAAPSTFTDVEDGKWYADAASWAAANGIVNGVGDNKFQPEGLITRQDFATILHRYAAFKGYDVSERAGLSGYADIGSVRPYALEAMQWAVAEGLIVGSSGLLDASGSAIRAQAAAILARFCANVA